MGASGWQYFVPYQEDIQQALSDLRDQVFESGRYYKRFPFWQEMNEEDYANSDAPQHQGMVEWIRGMKAMKEPTTLQELMEWNGEDGTHSILDINRVGDKPDIGVAAPLSEAEMMEFFDSTQPNREAVETGLDSLQSFQ